MLRLSYDEISPITGNKTVLVEIDPFTNDEIKLCMESGYQTYTNNWKVDNAEIINALMMQFPEDIVNTRIIDPDGNVWFKSYLISTNVILYPELDSWKVARLCVLDPGSGIDVDIPISPEEFVKKYVDVDNARIFNQYEYEDALFEFQRIITEIRLNNEN